VTGLVALGPLAISVAVFLGPMFGDSRTVGATVTEASRPSTQRADTAVKSPAAGSAARTAILDGVRARLGVTARFKVTFIRASEQWAFVRCVEVVADGADLQETDLDVAALLQRKSGANGTRWEVVELWALSNDNERPYTPFARRVRQRAKNDRLPDALFPTGFLTSDVPVQ
jgi:hypothetical protein